SMSARGDLDDSVEAPMIFIGYGLQIPEAKWDELAGQDLHGKIAVYVTTPAPVNVADNVRSHVSSGGERWAVLKKAGAIGIATLPNLQLPAATPDAAPTATGAGRGRGGAPSPQPTVVLAVRELQEQGGQVVSVTMTRRGAEKLLAGSGHTLEEL